MPCTRYTMSNGGTAIVCTRGSTPPPPAPVIEREVEASRRDVAAAEGRSLAGLTVLQPWASCLLAPDPYRKPVENRTWAPPGAGELAARPRWIAIHAGRRDYVFDDKLGLGWRPIRQLWPGLPNPEEWPRGAILGLARLVRATRYTSEAEAAAASPWCVGPWGWWFDTVIPVASPLPCRGAQGLWPVPDNLLPTLRDAYRAFAAQGFHP